MKKLLPVVLSGIVIISIFLYNSEAGAQYVPDDIMKKIRYQASEKHPNNEVLQQREISLQTKAYFEVKDFSSELIADQEMNIIRGNAARLYPYNYVGQFRFLDQKRQKYEEEAKAKKEQEEKEKKEKGEEEVIEVK